MIYFEQDGKRHDLARACRRAADVIERSGFQKDGFGTDDGPKCALGAIRYAVNGHTHENLGSDLGAAFNISLFKAVRPRSSKFGTLVLFNDSQRRRKHDVVRVLRDMARYAEEHDRLP